MAWWSTTSSAPPGWPTTESLDQVQAVIDQGSADPGALRQVNANLAPFYRSDCALNYCARDWDTHVLLDDGFYDCTMGTCPSAHRHMVDD